MSLNGVGAVWVVNVWGLVVLRWGGADRRPLLLLPLRSENVV